ncbi:MAG: Cna B-type domain-containing protein [Clostridia bacterium]|nr:Cna B-type domain-containing protein [Clostridia bacterium]
MMTRKVFALLLALIMICTAAVFCPGFAEDDTSWATQTDLDPDEEEEDDINDEPRDIAVPFAWVDDNNAYGCRPESVDVHLFADGEEVASATVKAGEQGCAFTGLPSYDHEKKQYISYNISTGTVSNPYRIVITEYSIACVYDPGLAEKCTLMGHVTWDHGDSGTDWQPESVALSLERGGKTVKMALASATTNWTAVFTDMPGNAEEYRMTIQGIKRYDLEKVETRGTEVDFTLKIDVGGFKPEPAPVPEPEIGPASRETVGTQDGGLPPSVGTDGDDPGEEEEPDPVYLDFPVVAFWDDMQDRDGNRPDLITVRLYADGVEIASHVLTHAENFQYVFSALPVFKEDGRTRINYTISVGEVPMYATRIYGHHILMEATPELTSATASVIWNDDGNSRGYRPFSLAVSLVNSANPDAEAYVFLLSDENGWTATVNNLPTVVNGRKSTYSMRPQMPVGYWLVSKAEDGNNNTVFTFMINYEEDAYVPAQVAGGAESGSDSGRSEAVVKFVPAVVTEEAAVLMERIAGAQVAGNVLSALGGDIAAQIPAGYTRVAESGAVKLTGFSGGSGNTDVVYRSGNTYAAGETVYAVMILPAEDGEQYFIAEGTGLADGSLRFACGAEMLKNLADRTFVMLLLKKAE